MQFGRTSERLAQHIDQLELRLEDLETNRASRPISPVLEPMLTPSKPAEMLELVPARFKVIRTVRPKLN